MSRIAGIVSREDAVGQRRSLSTMLASMAGAGWRIESETSGQVALGWCGPEEASTASAGGVVAVMDGMIYDHDGSTAGLTGAALLVELYAKYGFEGALHRLNGDFAAALYDSGEGALWLARDRFGVKPLYYVADEKQFAFASRPRALLGLPGVSREVNRRFVAMFAASHYRYLDNHPEESAYAAVRQLPAAHLLRLKNGDLSRRRYWQLEDLPDFGESEETLGARYRELLFDAVAKRLKVARQPAFTLSGGMDSSSVLGTAVALTGGRQPAFSAVYADKTYDESAEIRSMLAETVEPWHRILVDAPDVFALVRRMIEAHDEPVATATWLSHYLLCEEAARHGFGSLFGGLGGDELNAGEYEHFLYHFADLRASRQDALLAREIDHWARHHDHPVFRKSREGAERDMARLTDSARPGRCLPDRLRLGRYAGALNPHYFDLRSLDPVMEHPFRSYLKNRTYQDLTRETLPCCLRAEDRQATAFGLQRFLPFLDHRVVEFMFRVPGRLKIRDGVAKVLLREAMRGVLPEETRTRVKKTGWNAPAHLWFSGTGQELLLDLVHSRRFRERGIYDSDKVQELIGDHARIVGSGAPDENHMMFLWQLVNLELWFEWFQGIEGEASRSWTGLFTVPGAERAVP